MTLLPHTLFYYYYQSTFFRLTFKYNLIGHKVIKWFWKCIGELDDTDAARLLQFSTGTARVPVQGFKLLQGRDGDVRKFTITSIKLKDSVFPKAHTCFNRIELPIYKNYEQLKRYVTDAIHMELTGFGME